jgi:hypothetical protein
VKRKDAKTVAKASSFLFASIWPKTKPLKSWGK